jgi:hypothetical protein
MGAPFPFPPQQPSDAHLLLALFGNAFSNIGFSDFLANALWARLSHVRDREAALFEQRSGFAILARAEA